MPKRNDIKSILIIGSGPIVIGQSCEFDYSGSQACRALMEEGFRVILHNSNPATIMTDIDMAHATYLEPITLEVIEKIIEKERPDAILTTMGGQTALNLSVELHEKGILEKNNVELIGASYESIKKAEDRKIFRTLVSNLGYKMPYSKDAANMSEALNILEEFGLPCIVRDSFNLGGNKSGIAYKKQEFIDLCKNIFSNLMTLVTIDQSVIGFKEYELEIVRDSSDNCIVVCSIENFNPVGVHTGDSITVAPAQTLTDKEYQIMRKIAFDVMREIGIDTGGANIQFALNPLNNEILIIEVNPRVSRSSALASKATGFPIAKIAAKLSVGYTLDELRNDISNFQIPSSFEPTIDYVVTKIPRFDFRKFPNTKRNLDTQMRSVGEAMGIGRNFGESIQKSLQSLEEDYFGLKKDVLVFESSAEIELKLPCPDLIFKISYFLRNGYTITEINKITKVDCWFLDQLNNLVNLEALLKDKVLQDIDSMLMFNLKRAGFSDPYIANLIGNTEENVREYRHCLNIFPVYKRVDSCAAEFETSTSYLYSSYDEECEANPSNNKKVLILGSGPNRIGQGIEFDYSCTHSALQLRKAGFEVIMVNSNPETVSTDFNISNKLYFEPLTFGHVYEIINKEKPLGVIYQFGGQTPLKLISNLEKAGVKLLGPNSNIINLTEDRELFQKFLTEQNIPTFLSLNISSADEIISKEFKYPIILRPSYVIGGRYMEIIYNIGALKAYIKKNNIKVDDTKLFIEEFIEDAIELDVDLIYDGESVFFCGIMEQIEHAGVHSGDSIAVFPTFSLNQSLSIKIKNYSEKIAIGLNAIGPMNIQFAVKNDSVYVIEVNLRSSRTVPFLSKATNINIPGIASLCLLGRTLKEQNVNLDYNQQNLKNYFIKMPIFSSSRFSPADFLLGPEMKSTGEVMCFSRSLHTAVVKSFHAAGINLSSNSKILFYKIPSKYCVQILKKILSIQNFEKLYFFKNNKILAQKIENVFPEHINKTIFITDNYYDVDFIVNIKKKKANYNNKNLLDSIILSLRNRKTYEISSPRTLELISNIRFEKENVAIKSLQEVSAS